MNKLSPLRSEVDGYSDINADPCAYIRRCVISPSINAIQHSRGCILID